jgi:acetyl-CoA carboxylase carboxyl transferase subunit alpha
MGGALKAYLERYLRQLVGKPADRLLEERYQKFRKMGVFDEGVFLSPAQAPSA